jgi:peptidoglycan hydrolase-like protein with peptidoglycan-binding domain
MRRITDSLLKRIVRRSLNESYGLLNEYDITTTTKIGNIPIGTTINNMSLPQCPDGGFCYSTLDQAKKDYESLSTGGSGGLIQKYCPSKNVPNRKGKGIAMGKPTYNTTKIQQLSGELWSELTDTGMDPADIKNGLRSLENFPNFCKSEELFYSYWSDQPTYDPGAGVGSVYNGFEGTNWYGIINDDPDDRDNYFNEIAQLFQASIEISDEQYTAWLAELNANYKVTKDAADKLAKDELDKKNRKAKIIGGGGEYVKWLQEHPALINKSEIITTDRGDANLYSLNTNDPIINQYQYGVLLIVDPNNPSLDGTYDDVRVKKGTDIAVSINPATDKFWQFAISQNDVWRYDDVAWSDAFNPAFGGKLALTTSPDLEDDGKLNKSIQTERTKGFRHNLLTEVELKYNPKKPYLAGPDVVAIQKKLNISTTGGYGPETQRTVAAFQTKKGITPVTGDVDEDTYKAIMAEPDPIVPSATAWTRDLNIGSTGPDVDAIQTKLKLKTGKYGTDTQTAVMDYQKKYTDLDDTGIVDQKTFDHIMANTKLGTPSTFSGKKPPYKKGDWIVVKPNSGNEASQLYENNGYFKILDVPDAYTIIIDADWQGSGYATIGGTTAKIIFGPEAIEGVKTIPTVSNNSSNNKEKGKRNNVDNSGRRTNSGTNTVDTEKQRKRELRLNETCKTLREIKQYLNNTKGLSMVVNCKWNQEIRNQVMMALTGGTPVPVDQPQYNVVQPESPTNQFL